MIIGAILGIIALAVSIVGCILLNGTLMLIACACGSIAFAILIGHILITRKGE